MQAETRRVIEHCARTSNDGSSHFGDIVTALLEVGVESYHADYRARRSTYYLPDGESLTVELPVAATAIAEAFDGVAIRAAILGAQRGEIIYPEFKHLSQAAGCVGYIVWLAGRHAVYFGRRGETHVERFPD